MTISTTNNIAGPFDGNDVATAFPFSDIKVLQNSDLDVYHTPSGSIVDVLLVEGVDYTLALNTDQDVSPGGTITYPISGSPLATGDKLTGQRVLEVLQDMDLTNQGNYNPEVVEISADKAVMIMQQNLELLSRTIKLPVSESGIEMLLPNAADRASKLLGFDASGNVISTSTITTALVTTFMETLLDDPDASTALTTLGISDFMKTMLDDVDAANARTTLIAAGLTDANIFTKSQYLKKGADIVSANDLVLLSDGNSNDITGTTTVNGMTDGVQNETRHFHADGVFTLKHNTATSAGFSKLFIVQGAADITTAANDEWDAIYDGTVWRIVNYDKAAGTSVIATPAAAGRAIQVVNTVDGAVATGTTLTPFDDTIPQNTEGDEFMTLAITPTNSSNKLKIEVVFNGTTTSIGSVIAVALFQDSIAAALAVVPATAPAGEQDNASLIHYMIAGTTSEITFKIRAGSDTAGTVTFNGRASARFFGGLYSSSIIITEVQV